MLFLRPFDISKKVNTSSCQRSLWKPSNDGALGERTEEKHCSKGRKEEMLNVVDSIWIEAWPDFSSLFLLVGQGRFMYHLLSLREREAIHSVEIWLVSTHKYNNQINFFLTFLCYGLTLKWHNHQRILVEICIAKSCIYIHFDIIIRHSGFV